MLPTDFPFFHQSAFINGQWILGEPQARQTVTNPFDGSLIGSVPLLSAAQVQEAILRVRKRRKFYGASNPLKIKQKFCAVGMSLLNSIMNHWRSY